MNEIEFNKRPLWKIVERLNFNRDVAAWEEHLIKANVDYYEAKEFIDRNKGRVLFAYIPHYSGGGMEAIMWNKKYKDSVKLERKYAKLID